MRLVSCKNCGAKVSDQYSFCTECGIAFGEKAERSGAKSISPSLVDWLLTPFGTGSQRPQVGKSQPLEARPLVSRSCQAVYTGSVFFLLRQSLIAYKNNLPLIVPVIVSIVTWITTSFVAANALPQLLSSINSGQTLEEQGKILYEALGLLPYLFVFAFISFLVTLGLMTMIGQIVTGHKCKLSDWIGGIRAFFWRISAVSIVVGLVFGLISGATAPMTLRTIRIVSISIEASVATLSQLILYFCCAAIIVDNAGLQASISFAIKAIQRSGRNFLILFVLYYMILYGRTILGTPNLFSSGLSGISSLSSIMSAQIFVYTIFSSSLLPLWLLVVFMLYCKEMPQNQLSLP